MRNPFFRLALDRAARMAGKPGRVLKLLAELAVRMYRTDWKKLKAEDIKDKFNVLGRLSKAFVTGQYREIPWKALLSALAALIYFLNPLDLIPDWLGPLGLTDDFAVLTWVYASLGEELQKFLDWEKTISQRSEGNEGDSVDA
jgi:uncharacterized membrane protein YkvA (DUF1232 family)